MSEVPLLLEMEDIVQRSSESLLRCPEMITVKDS